jgi:hypothetical protein
MAVSISSVLHQTICSFNVSVLLTIRQLPLNLQNKHEHNLSLCQVQTAIWPQSCWLTVRKAVIRFINKPQAEIRSSTQLWVPVPHHWWTGRMADQSFVSDWNTQGEGCVLGFTASLLTDRPRKLELLVQRQRMQTGIYLNCISTSKQVLWAPHLEVSIQGMGPEELLSIESYITATNTDFLRFHSWDLLQNSLVF